MQSKPSNMNYRIVNGPDGKKANDYVRPTPYHVIIIHCAYCQSCAHSRARRCGSKLTMNVTDGIDVMNIGGLTTIPPQHRTTDQAFIMEMIKPRPPTAPTSAFRQQPGMEQSRLDPPLHGDQTQTLPQTVTLYDINPNVPVENSEDDHDMD